ncbi:MAG: APC family permease [Saccharolobus sp.]
MSNSSISKTQEKQEPKRHLSFIDIVFLSMGGQSPFLSILTYGITVFLLVGAFAPIAIILGTLLVLINGLVVYELSKRFTKEGGYYTYVFYSLTKKLGFETGWLYLFYSTTYGVAYIYGASFILYHVLGINPWIAGLGLLSITSLFSIMGIRISTKYAIVTSLLEIGIMTLLATLFIQSTGFHFYNPFSYNINLDGLALAILFGSGIPTGYGSITPISGEAKDARRTVSSAIITVILLGGLLAAFDVYAIGDHLLFFHIPIQSVDILSLIKNRLGLVTFIFVIFAALNDGILGSLSFLTATSRTIFAMAATDFLPKIFSKFENYRGPINAIFLSVAFYFITTIIGLYFITNPFIAFGFMGSVALLASLFVHIASNFSLVRISIRKIRKRVPQLVLGIVAAIFSIYDLIYSMMSSVPLQVYIFMGWIIIGFLVIEVINMIEEGSEED